MGGGAFPVDTYSKLHRLFKVGLAEVGGPKKEIYNVTAIWLRLIATTHQEDVQSVTMLIQQWFNLFGRWPITIAFFVAGTPRKGKDKGAEEVPEGLKGDVYEAAMWFKAYLTDLAKIHYALPMVPVFWEVSLFLPADSVFRQCRVSLSVYARNSETSLTICCTCRITSTYEWPCREWVS